MRAYPVIPALALVRRELTTTLRRPRSFVFLAVFCLACTGVALANWPAQGLTLQMAGSTSRSVFMILAGVVWAAAVLLVPGLAAGAISLEREQDTYDQLILSLISPSGVVLAKLFNAVGYFLLLLASIVPIVSAVLFLVGLDAWQVVYASGIIFLSLLTCAAVGLACSAAIPKTAPAIVMTYLVVLAALGGAGVVVVLINTALTGGHIDNEAIALVPPALLYLVITEGTPYTYVALLTSFYLLSITTVCLFVATRYLRRAPKPARISRVNVIDDATVLEARRRRFPYYLIDPLRRRAPIEDEINPMLAKEMRWGWFTRATGLIRVFYLCTFMFLFACARLISSGTDIDDAIFLWVMLECLLVILVAPTLMANAFAKEYEMHNIDMLRMTLLEPREIVRGKVVSALFSMSPLLFAGGCASLLLLVAASLAGEGFVMVITGTLTFLVTALVSLALGIAASVATRRTGASLVLSYVLQLGVFYIVPALLFSMGMAFAGFDSSGGRSSNPDTRARMALHAASISPVLSYAASLDRIPRIRLKQGYSPPWQSRDEMDFKYWQANTTLIAIVSLGLLAGSTSYFARRRMRDP